jgi:hypothetical protein
MPATMWHCMYGSIEMDSAAHTIAYASSSELRLQNRFGEGLGRKAVETSHGRFRTHRTGVWTQPMSHCHAESWTGERHDDLTTTVRPS